MEVNETPWGLPQDVESTAWERMAPFEPRGYVCHYVSEPPRIDGRLDDEAWADAPWSDAFIDIEGEREPYLETRMAMRWDDDHLYIAARLEEPHVWGTLTEQNSVIYNDNDFEVFIDPDGDNHNYYELEINALNTIWELRLERPYRDGGPVVSPANVDGLRTAVHVDGTLNAPHDTDRFWSIEIAIPFRGLVPNAGARPSDGATWRINFSRVQWPHEIVGASYRKPTDAAEENWVWTPQGVVDMHRPERWGYVQFTRARPGHASFERDPTLEVRDALMAFYYAQKAFVKEHGRWARSPNELPQSPHDGVRLKLLDEGWTATLKTATREGAVTLQVNHESRLVVLP